MGQLLLSEYGGPDGEIGASMRYLSQRYSMENRIAAGTLTDIGISVLVAVSITACLVVMITLTEYTPFGCSNYYLIFL